tara:strand:+ start:145 stop:543 length:399 start_codon:yes stop_codon:yes gene_type:complete
MADKQAIMNALKQAMAGRGGGPSTSKRPMARPKSIGGGMTDGTRGPSPMRPEMIGGGMGEGSSGIPPEQNYSEEDLMRLLMSAGAKSGKKPAGFMRGGKVQGYFEGGVAAPKKKSKNGCVMKGRGGKYKGMK